MIALSLPTLSYLPKCTTQRLSNYQSLLTISTSTLNKKRASCNLFTVGDSSSSDREEQSNPSHRWWRTLGQRFRSVNSHPSSRFILNCKPLQTHSVSQGLTALKKRDAEHTVFLLNASKNHICEGHILLARNTLGETNSNYTFLFTIFQIKTLSTIYRALQSY